MSELVPLTVQVVDERDHTVVRLDGELDLATAPDLDACLQQLAAAGSVRLLLDLSKVDFCDSTGLNRIVAAARRSAEAGGWLRLAAPQPQLLRVLELTGLLPQLATYPSLSTARAGGERARFTEASIS
jgi:anti-sigma B factor antagonist